MESRSTKSRTKYRITITTDSEAEGTALLFILAELIKDVPGIVQNETFRTYQEMDDGDVRAFVKRVKVKP